MTATTVLPKPGDHLAGKYFIESQLGGGRSSVVFGATDLATSRRYAIRWWVSADAASAALTTEQFIRTARSSRLFDQPGLAQTYHVAKTSSGAFFAITEWLDGYTLDHAMQRSPQLPLLDVCNYLLPCMHAVSAAHDIGIVHADLRPAKVFVCHATKGRAERACILDFVGGERWRRGRTLDARELAVLGTEVAYLAPEQVRDGTIDPRSDVYAFGVILYRALAGRLPFDMRRLETVPDQIVQSAVKPLRVSAPGLPLGIVEIVTRAMALDPAERYQDLTAFALELDRFCLHSETEEAPFLWIKSAAAIAPLLSVESTTLRMQRVEIKKRPPPRRSTSYLAVLALLGGGALLYWRAQTALTQSSNDDDVSDALPLPPSGTHEARGLAPGAVALEAVNAPDRAPARRDRATESDPARSGPALSVENHAGGDGELGSAHANAAASGQTGPKAPAAVSGERTATPSGVAASATVPGATQRPADPHPGLDGADGTDPLTGRGSSIANRGVVAPAADRGAQASAPENAATSPAADRGAPSSAATSRGRFGAALVATEPSSEPTRGESAADSPRAPAPVPVSVPVNDEVDPLDHMTLQ